MSIPPEELMRQRGYTIAREAPPTRAQMLERIRERDREIRALMTRVLTLEEMVRGGER